MALRLYRRMLRGLRELPPATRDYYHGYALQQFYAHTDETDPERIEAMLERGNTDLGFILKKYRGKTDGDVARRRSVLCAVCVPSVAARLSELPQATAASRHPTHRR